jgi:acyl-CoA synthetase (AMP-forming)/AMP-acid ligase II
VTGVHTFTLGDVLREHRRSRPHVTAVVDGDVRLTYAELDDRVNQVAQGLVLAGVGAGDRILWLGQNSFRVLELLFAAAKLGAIVCPANWRQTADELRFVVDDLDPAVVVWQEDEIGAAVAAARTPDARTWIQHDATGPGSYEDLVRGGKTEDPDVDVDPGSPVLALYTAAFDGRPNAALLSHDAILSHDLAIALVRQVEAGFSYLNAGPLFHVATMFFCTATAHLGGTNVFLARFDAEMACQLIERERCQAMLLLPPMVQEIAAVNADGRYDLSSLRSPRISEAWDQMVTLDTSPWGRALGGYGQTEAAGILTFSAFGIGGLGTHGRPSPFVTVRIVDPDGVEVPTGEVGEIVARGRHLMTGYFNRPELNARRQAGGWHHTGDLGRREDDGTITFIGPAMRMIKSGAENIYPAEVERCLATHPAVAECAVIGVPDPTWGQTVKAIVVAAPGAAPSVDELVDHCRAHIASYKRPRSVELVDAIPRSGFVPDYAALDERFGGGGYPML